MNLIAVFIALTFFYSLVSGRVDRAIPTAQILFTPLACWLSSFCRNCGSRLAISLCFSESPRLASCRCSLQTPSRTDHNFTKLTIEVVARDALLWAKMMGAISEMLNRGVEQLLGRADGPFHFRLLVMPTVVAILAIRAVRGAREGQPAFLWALLTNPFAPSASRS